MNINHNESKKIKEFFYSYKNQRWFLVIIAILVNATFIGIAYLSAKPGFPLDDSWIHQTYARHLALTSRWEFVPGEISAGSTSPLWTMLLSLGFLLGFSTPFLWTVLMSTILSFGMTLFTFEIIREAMGEQKAYALLGSLFLLLDWHMLWSVGSGMETILFCCISLLIVKLLFDGSHWIWIGILTGLLVWVRPDGITFLGPVLLILGWKLINKQAKLMELINLFIPLIISLILYGWFNYSLSGNILPNTFFAKQKEYAIFLQNPLWKRLGQIFLVPMSGAGLFLIPGFLRSIWKSLVNRNIWLISLILWFCGYGILYALRLPMTYQHGRYLFPLIPIYFVVGLIGTYDWISTKPGSVKISSIVIRIFAVCALASSVVFAIVGESAYVTDLQTIDEYMVKPAHWIRQNTPKDAIIAAHDIGTLGFYGERKIIDLAGLIQPDIIPIIRNEEAIKGYLIDSRADYLVLFKDWYNNMDQFGTIVATFRMQDQNWPEIVEIRELTSITGR